VVGSLPARLVAGLMARRDASSGAITILSCDNLPENGAVTETVVTDLAHMTDLASLDPRTWAVNWPSASGLGPWEGTTEADASEASVPPRSPIPHPRSPLPGPRSPIPGPRSPICVAIDILDEDHSLRLAMRRLAVDRALGAALGRAARDWWAREHTVETMAGDYERVMRDAAARPDPVVDLPAHMRNAGDRQLESLMMPFGRGPLARRGLGGGA